MTQGDAGGRRGAQGRTGFQARKIVNAVWMDEQQTGATYLLDDMRQHPDCAAATPLAGFFICTDL